MLDCSEWEGGGTFRASYLASKLVVTVGIRWEYCFIILPFFSVLARLVLFVIATLTLTNFWGLLKKNLLLRHAPLTLLGVGSSRRSSEETVLGEPFPRYVIDTRISTQTAFVCDYGFAFPTLAFWNIWNTQRAKLCPPILLWKGLCKEIILAMVDYNFLLALNSEVKKCNLWYLACQGPIFILNTEAPATTPWSFVQRPCLANYYSLFLVQCVIYVKAAQPVLKRRSTDIYFRSCRKPITRFLHAKKKEKQQSGKARYFNIILKLGVSKCLNSQHWHYLDVMTRSKIRWC